MFAALERLVAFNEAHPTRSCPGKKMVLAMLDTYVRRVLQFDSTVVARYNDANEQSWFDPPTTLLYEPRRRQTARNYRESPR